MLSVNEPKTYQQWMGCLEYLSKKNVSDEFVDSLSKGVCPGIERVMVPFLERVQDTVNEMLNRYTRNCTRSLKESLEECDFSNVETILYRNYKAMERCRFYLNIRFIPETFAGELDRRTVSEINRYWKELRIALERAVEESGDSNVYDIIYYTNRLISKDRCNGQL